MCIQILINFVYSLKFRFRDCGESLLIIPVFTLFLPEIKLSHPKRAVKDLESLTNAPRASKLYVVE